MLAVARPRSEGHIDEDRVGTTVLGDREGPPHDPGNGLRRNHPRGPLGDRAHVAHRVQFLKGALSVGRERDAVGQRDDRQGCRSRFQQRRGHVGDARTWIAVAHCRASGDPRGGVSQGDAGVLVAHQDVLDVRVLLEVGHEVDRVAREPRAHAGAMLTAIRHGKATSARPPNTAFESVAEEVFRRYARNWKPGTLAVNRQYLRNQILPYFKGRPIAEINGRGGTAMD